MPILELSLYFDLNYMPMEIVHRRTYIHLAKPPKLCKVPLQKVFPGPHFAMMIHIQTHKVNIL